MAQDVRKAVALAVDGVARIIADVFRFESQALGKLQNGGKGLRALFTERHAGLCRRHDGRDADERADAFEDLRAVFQNLLTKLHRYGHSFFQETDGRKAACGTLSRTRIRFLSV